MISLSWCRTLQLVLLVTSPQLPAENPPSEQNDHYGYEVELRPVQLPERLVTAWLDELLPLLDDEEARDIRSTFTRLPGSSARLRFFERFWRDRDPEPRTILNETRRQFERHRAVALAAGWSLSDPRSNLILRHGQGNVYLLTAGTSYVWGGVPATRRASARGEL